MPLGLELGLGPGHIVLDGEPAPPPKKGHSSPHFLAPVYCGQTAGRIKVPLGTEVDLCPGHIVLGQDPASPMERGTGAPSHFLADVCWGKTVVHLSNC